MKTTKKSIIFDMDGTIIDSGDIIANTINHVRKNIGLEPMAKDYLLENINNPNINSSEFFYETNDFTKQHIKLFETYYKEHCTTQIKLYDGIQSLLEDLYNNGFILTIATNAYREFAIQMTQYLNIYQYFKDIVGANQVTNAKPDPEMVNYLIDKHKFIKSQTVLVGDSPKDILCAKNANIDSILVDWGFSDHNAQPNAIQTIDQLRAKFL